MCGFGGIINSKKVINKSRLSKIAGNVSFRGPDSCGIRILDENLNNAEEGNTAVFFNRLAIIDLDKRSDQPFEDDRYMLVFNGEIYNYEELKIELVGKNINFTTTSDTEVLFHSLREWGTDILPRLNGMFAFFWLDKKERTFIVARDRLGIKPLSYSYDGSTFIYASEVDSIVKMLSVKPRISSEAVEMYLWMQSVPTPYTIFQDIYKLPPGNYIKADIDSRRKPQVKCYWDVYTFIHSNAVVNSSDLETILKNSLTRQLHADVPLGLFLSSGVDSSLLAAMVNKYFSSGKAVNFFTVRFEEQTSSDESADAENFIRGFNNSNLKCNTISVNHSFIQNHIDDLYNYYDEPFADPAALLNWAISKKARQYVTVAISGDGADELFWGYDRYIRWQKFKKISKMPLMPPVIEMLNQEFPGNSFLNNAKFLLERNPVKRHFNFFLPSGMRHKINDHISDKKIWALDNIELVKSRTDLPAILDLKTYLPDAMLYKVDRSSMASSLEVRVPYLDNELLEYALQLNHGIKSNSQFQTKAPLKALLSKLAPQYDLSKKKKGFNFPLRKWLKENWKDQVLSVVNTENLVLAKLEPKPYLKIVNDFYLSKNNYFTDVWFLFNLCLWVKKFKTIESSNDG